MCSAPFSSSNPSSPPPPFNTSSVVPSPLLYEGNRQSTVLFSKFLFQFNLLVQARKGKDNRAEKNWRGREKRKALGIGSLLCGPI
ncbi:hypothetical protein VNO78_21177 [Psophocarpus tetragonolobus]|uniref:Uncharacterized protein n=1 Tax=Psophocarpus tetragonolobus TaxID=3891 RepID=A0AAN9SBS6_PSOTE